MTRRSGSAGQLSQVWIIALAIGVLSVIAVALMLIDTAPEKSANSCKSDFGGQFEVAESLRANAAAAGAEWLETGDLLNNAKEAAAVGDTDQACVFLEQAAFQAEMAIRQAEQEAGAWAGRVVR